MRRLLIPTLISFSLLLPASAGATNKPKTTHFTITSVANSIANGESPMLLAGNLKGSLGQGAIVISSKAVSSTTATATFTCFTQRGALKGVADITFSATGPVGSSGETLLKGTGSFKSGTAAYKDATGKFTFSGISPSGQDYYRLTLKGSLTLSAVGKS